MTNQCKAIKTAAKLVLFVELHKFLWNDYCAPYASIPPIPSTTPRISSIPRISRVHRIPIVYRTSKISRPSR